MSVKLSRLNKLKEKRSVQILFGDDTLSIDYNRAKYTPKFEREIKEMMDANLPAGSLAKMVFALILDWDLTDDKVQEKTTEDGVVFEFQNAEGKWGVDVPEDERVQEPVPLTWEVFDALLSVDALTTLVEKLAEDNRPNVKSSDSTSDSF
jgi:hypothetical protein